MSHVTKSQYSLDLSPYQKFVLTLFCSFAFAFFVSMASDDTYVKINIMLDTFHKAVTKDTPAIFPSGYSERCGNEFNYKIEDHCHWSFRHWLVSIFGIIMTLAGIARAFNYIIT